LGEIQNVFDFKSLLFSRIEKIQSPTRKIVYWREEIFPLFEEWEAMI
jgi:hypothetical protein